MRRYLKQFLSDRRVIELPRWKWWPILNLIILTVRPGRKGKDYAKIWNKERNEGPLKTITRSQAEKLAARLGDERIVVDWAMRYANPSTAARIEALQKRGCDRMLLVPLYPQYAAATTATACDEAFRALMQLRWQPAVRVAPAYHDDPAYIDALAASIRTHLARLDFEPEARHRLLPRHAAALPRRRRPLPLPVPEDLAARCARRWAGPASAGTRPSSRASATSPGCSPTPSRRSSAWRSPASSASPSSPPASPPTAWRRWRSSTWRTAPPSSANGGERFAYVPCLNDSEAGMRVIEAVVRRELMGWV